jgi:phosphate transport system substrate-binding protein
MIFTIINIMLLKRLLQIMLIVFLLGHIPNNVYAAQIITGSGCSVSKVGYLSAIAREYERLTGVKVLVRGGSSVVGIKDLAAGRVDFAASCQKKMPSDPGGIEFIQVAWDTLVFIAHKSNPVDNITINDIREIYEGKITNWKQLNGPNMPIRLFMARPGGGLGGIGSHLKEMVLEGKTPTAHAKILASAAIVEQLVEEIPEGFATSGFSSSHKRDVKILEINGISPNKENIIRGRYPLKLKRPLFIVIPKNPKPEVQKFVEFILSKEGQQFISSQGVVPLSDIR